jgi:hypothetical protein
MATPTRSTLLALGALLVLASSLQAASPLPGFARVGETQNFVFYSRDGQKVDAEKTQKLFEKVARLLGSAPEGQANYYRYQYPEQVAVATGILASGVTLPESGEIHSAQSYHPHEIVHRVAAALGGDPGRFFQEGLAVALGDGGVWKGLAVRDIARRLVSGATDTQKLIDGFANLDADVAYPLAGSFVEFLLKTHGALAVGRFFAGCTKSENRDAAFARVFGINLETASHEWVSSLKSSRA